MYICFWLLHCGKVPWPLRIWEQKYDTWRWNFSFYHTYIDLGGLWLDCSAWHLISCLKWFYQYTSEVRTIIMRITDVQFHERKRNFPSTTVQWWIHFLKAFVLMIWGKSLLFLQYYKINQGDTCHHKAVNVLEYQLHLLVLSHCKFVFKCTLRNVFFSFETWSACYMRLCTLPIFGFVYILLLINKMKLSKAYEGDLREKKLKYENRCPR